jgi:hypothetical protein
VDARDGVLLVERVINAPTRSVFDVLAVPHRHAEIAGSESLLRGSTRGPDRLFLGAVFTVRMRLWGLAYLSSNEVTEFEEGVRIAWRTHAVVAGRPAAGGQVWRYQLSGHDGHTLVRHECEWQSSNIAALLVLSGHPRRMQLAMSRSLHALDRLVTGADENDRDQPSW